MSTTSVADAETAAADARREQVQAERDLATGARKIPFAKLHEIRDRARHAELAQQSAHVQAERERAAARRAALEDLAGEIDAAAADPVPGLAEALADLGEAAGRAKEAARSWDARVEALTETAEQTGCHTEGSIHPRAEDNLVAPQWRRCGRGIDAGVQHGDATLRVVGPLVATMIQRAVTGDSAVAAAAARAQAVQSTPLPSYSRGAGR